MGDQETLTMRVLLSDVEEQFRNVTFSFTWREKVIRYTEN